MKLLDHPNVLPLIGVSVDSENFPAMVLPYMVNGDVKSYLFSQRDSEIDVDTLPEVSLDGSIYTVTPQYLAIPIFYRTLAMKCCVKCVMTLQMEWDICARCTLYIVI